MYTYTVQYRVESVLRCNGIRSINKNSLTMITEVVHEDNFFDEMLGTPVENAES